MRIALSLALTCLASTANACAELICIVDPESLDLTRIITFEGTQSTAGPGWQIDAVLVMEGASFGERFAGQTQMVAGDHDVIDGAASAPLTLLSGAPGAALSLVRMNGNTLLNGYGPAGFPKRQAQGEGAIAWVFDEDQSALSFQLRGGEGGQAQAQFLRRDGSVIDVIVITPVGEHAIGFQRGGKERDIAAVVLTNTDPQGVALDNLRFSRPPELG